VSEERAAEAAQEPACRSMTPRAPACCLPMRTQSDLEHEAGGDMPPRPRTEGKRMTLDISRCGGPSRGELADDGEGDSGAVSP